MFQQGDSVLVRREAENLDPRGDEPWTVPEGTICRITGWRGLDGVVVSWKDQGKTESAVVLRSDIRPAPRVADKQRRRR
jgi:hypothetical protein